VTAYDTVRYPGRPHPATHPDRLAAIGALFGMAPAPVDHCRVLEIACGDGANLIPMAYGLPGSSFVGFDLASAPIEAGRQFAQRLGLTNLALETLDLRQFPESAGSFDYIIAHGLYSWIPAALRAALLALIASHLAPGGIAFVSYNTYPGCYLRRMVWDMLRFHTDELADPADKIAEAQGLMRLLAGGRSVQQVGTAPLQAEAERLLERDPAYLFHDDLADVNEPVYFHEFADAAAGHGLQFLGEAELQTMGYGGLIAEAKRVLADIGPLLREQYLDFLKCRRFRQTLLCHGAVKVERQPAAQVVEKLLLGVPGRVRVEQGRAVDAGADPVEREEGASRDEALLQTLLDVLEEASPQRLTFGQLSTRVRARMGPEVWAGVQPDAFTRLVYGAARAGAVTLHTHAPPLATAPGEQPRSSRLARLEVEQGSIVTSLCHDSVKLDDEVARGLLPLLDGSRSRAQLVNLLADRLDGHSDGPRAQTLRRHLDLLAKLALIEA
jgi:SAM-dependent methyltransferase